MHADDGPVEEIVAPSDALVPFQRLHGKVAPHYEGAVRPHRAGGTGFFGERFVSPGSSVEPGAPLIEIRGEEMG